MTVIAWDGTTLAADKQRTVNGRKLTGTKIHRIRKCLVGVTGDSDQSASLLAWFEDGEDPATYPVSFNANDWPQLIVIRPGADVGIYTRTPHIVVIEDRFVAFGSGAEYALATMGLGFDAVRAVEIASRFDVHCGMGIDTLTFDGTQPLLDPDNAPDSRPCIVCGNPTMHIGNTCYACSHAKAGG